MLDLKNIKKWGIGGSALIIVLFIFNSSQRPTPSKLERKYEATLESIIPSLSSTDPIDSLSPEVSISLEVSGGESFFVSSTNKNITREQLFRILQLINNTGLLAYSDDEEYILKVSIGEDKFIGSFSKETLLGTSARQSLAKLLSIYSKTPQILSGENNENKTGG